MRPRQRPSLRFWYFIIFLVLILGIFPLYSYYKRAAAPVPPGVLLDGIDVSRLKDVAAIRQQMEPLYREPIAVRFQDQTLVLHPAEVDFQPDFEQTLADAGRYLEGLDFVDIAVREAIGLPQQRRAVPLRYHVDEAKLSAWLNTAAARLDYPPAPPRVRVPAAAAAAALGGAVTPTMTTTTSQAAAGALAGAPVSAAPEITGTAVPTTPAPAPIPKLEWIPGSPGYQVDVEASLSRVAAALASHSPRTVDLALKTVAPPVPALSDLQDQLQRVLDVFPVFAGVYVHDLSRGDTASVDGDATFSGMSTLKIALAVALMEALPDGVAAGDADAQKVGQWLDAAIGQGDDGAADQALAWLGGGNAGAGAAQVTRLLQQIGLQNSFIQGGFASTVQLPALRTPSNQREKPNTRPDSNLQTTPADMGKLLSAIYECTQDRGLLRTTFPSTVTPEECRSILFYFTHNELRDVIWRGLPTEEQRWIVHQHGLSLWQHGDAALVWGPTGPYVISLYLFNPGLVGSPVANQAAIDLSRLVWQFFEFQRSQGAPAPADPPALASPPGYVSLDKYIPSAANPQGK